MTRNEKDMFKLARELAAPLGVSVEIETGGKHRKLVISKGAHVLRTTVAGSPGAHSSRANATAKVKRMVRAIGAGDTDAIKALRQGW